VTPAAKITKIVATVQDGGTTLFAFHMQLRPGRGKENLILQDRWRHSIAARRSSGRRRTDPP
jgi:hypothetical protein